MRRRYFIGVMGGQGGDWQVVAWGKQFPTLSLIGFLGANTAPSQRASTDAFTQRLRELGWVEGRDIRIEYRWAEGRFERSANLLAELLSLHADIIVTHATHNVLAAKRATACVPVAYSSVGA